MITGSSSSKGNKDPRIIDFIIGSVHYKALIDSGAMVNTITPIVYDEIKKNCWFVIQNVSIHPKENLKAYACDKPLDVICSFDAFISSRNSMQSQIFSKFFVVKGTTLSLLGYQTATKLGLLRIGNGDANIHSVCSVSSAAIHKEFPKVPMEGMKFRIDKNVTPKQIIRYNIPIAFEQETNTRLREMEAQGIIERADKNEDKITFVSPLVLVPKGKNDFRIVVDYREVNKAIIREPYPMPTLDRIWTEIPKGKGELFFTKLDLSNAFFHVKLHQNVRHFTTFMTANGLMRFKRLPFGLSCAPEIFQKVMEKVLVDCKGKIIYLDDILIFGTTVEELERRTSVVKATLERNHLTINEEKSQYKQTKINFVGLTIDGSGILPMESKINDILSFKSPKNLSELRSFLGMMVFVSPFITDFSSRTVTLRRLTRAKAIFKWETQHENEFQDLKNAASKGLVKRGYFSRDDQTILYTDASPWGLGAILVQRDPKTKAERVIACASKSLTPTESRYPQLHREALAIIWGMEKFTYYLLGSHFTLKSDSQALQFMINREKFKDCGKRIFSRAEGWFLRLEHFDYTFEHIPGEKNIADVPSRLTNHTNDSHYGFEKEYYDLCEVNGQPQAIPENLLILTSEKVKESIKSDTEIQKIIEWLNNKNTWPDDILRYQRFQNEMYLLDDTLMKSEKMVLPVALRYRALELAHTSHPGMSTMKFLLRQGVWWPAMDNDIEEFVRSCPCCQLIVEERKPLPIVLTKLPENIWDRVSLDFSTPNGTENWKALVLIDQYSRYMVAVAMKKTDTESVKKVLKRIFQIYNLPKEFLLDNGPPFNSRELKSWVESHGIKYKNTTPLNPTENGLVERKMAGINKVAAIARLEKKSFEEALSEYVMNYNTWPHHSTKIPPAELMFGRAVRGFLPNLKTETRQRSDTEFRKRDMEIKMRRNQIEDRKRHAGERTIEIGDKVLVHQQKYDKADTVYKNRFFEVIEIVGGRLTLRDISNGKLLERSIKHVKKYFDPNETRWSEKTQFSKTSRDTDDSEKEADLAGFTDEFDAGEGEAVAEEAAGGCSKRILDDDEPSPEPKQRKTERVRKLPKRYQDSFILQQEIIE